MFLLVIPKIEGPNLLDYVEDVVKANTIPINVDQQEKNKAICYYQEIHCWGLMLNSKGLKKELSITWQQGKEIIRRCPTCSLYNQIPLPAGSNPKGTQRNEIWQMDVLHFVKFG